MRRERESKFAPVGVVTKILRILEMLHDSPAGERFGRTHGSLEEMVSASGRLLRLPLWVGIPEAEQQEIVTAIYEHFQVKRLQSGNRADAASAR